MLNVARLEGEAAAGAAAALRLDVGEPPFARAGEPPFACAGADAGGAVVAREIRGIFFLSAPATDPLSLLTVGGGHVGIFR